MLNNPPAKGPHTTAIAAVDGFALRTCDVEFASTEKPVELKIVARITTEARWLGTLRDGEAAAVSKGAVIPRGSDTVIEQGKVREIIIPYSKGRKEFAQFCAPAKKGEHIIRA